MNRLRNKTAVVIGATGDVGSAIAHELAKEGANLVLAARKIETLAPIANQLEHVGPGKKIAIQTDSTNLLQVENLSKRTNEIFGGADILITSVGKWVRVKATDKAGTFVEQLRIDLESFCVAAAIPHFVFNQEFAKKKKGLGVDISSHAAKNILPGNLTYGTAKAGAQMFLNNLRAETKKDGVKILQIISQLIDTPTNRKAFPNIKKGDWKKTVQIKDIVQAIIKAHEAKTCKSVFLKSGIII